MRRAVEDDKNLQVTLLLRTAENKYWRGDVSDKDELLGGFPKTREELFAYRSIILGSVEAAAFTPEQLRMLADFVNKRGGGLLMLGGRRSFAEGGWGGTPVGEVLPVVMDAANPKYLSSEIAGPPDARRRARSPSRRSRATEDASATKWDDMPPLSRRQPDPREQAGRDGAAHRRRQRQAGSDRARVPALRTRQGDRDAGAGFLAPGGWTRRCRSPTRPTRCSGGA